MTATIWVLARLVADNRRFRSITHALARSYRHPADPPRAYLPVLCTEYSLLRDQESASTFNTDIYICCVHLSHYQIDHVHPTFAGTACSHQAQYCMRSTGNWHRCRVDTSDRQVARQTGGEADKQDTGAKATTTVFLRSDSSLSSPGAAWSASSSHVRASRSSSHVGANARATS